LAVIKRQEADWPWSPTAASEQAFTVGFDMDQNPNGTTRVIMHHGIQEAAADQELSHVPIGNGGRADRWQALGFQQLSLPGLRFDHHHHARGTQQRKAAA
jgi:hypothetical protein